MPYIRRWSALPREIKASRPLMMISSNRKWVKMVLLCCPNIVSHLPAASCLEYTHTHTHWYIIHWELAASARESFILKLFGKAGQQRIARRTSLLVNMSNASVAGTQNNTRPLLLWLSRMPPLFSRSSNARASVRSSHCGELCLICMSVCVGGEGGGGARVKALKRCWHPTPEKCGNMQSGEN